MAIIVDKVQKRQDIALSCKELLISKGIKNVSVSDLAKSANVSKGSIYDYFENKEDIVFEVFNLLLIEHNKVKSAYIDSVSSTRDKIKMFFNFFYNEEERELREFFREFVSINLSSPTKAMIEYQTSCHLSYRNWFKKLFEDGIANGELKPEAIKLVTGLFVFGNGIFLVNTTTNLSTNIQKDIDDYIDAIFDLIEIKE